MSHESQSLLKKMRDEMARVETRLAEPRSPIPVTGLMNRREMERCLDASEVAGESPVLLLFEFRGLTCPTKWRSKWARGWARSSAITI